MAEHWQSKRDISVEHGFFIALMQRERVTLLLCALHQRFHVVYRRQRKSQLIRTLGGYGLPGVGLRRQHRAKNHLRTIKQLKQLSDRK